MEIYFIWEMPLYREDLVSRLRIHMTEILYMIV